MANLSDKIGPSGVATGDQGVATTDSPAFAGLTVNGQLGIGGANYGTSGQVLTSNGSGSAPSWVTASSGGAAPVDTQTFTSSGTWTKPSSGSFAIIEVWGGGGSGGLYNSSGAGGGGGGGGYNVLQIDLSSLGSTETVTIGAGGAAVSASNAGGNYGGNTTFGSYLTGYGGGGGYASSYYAGGGGGMRGRSGSYNGGAGYEPVTTTAWNTYGNTMVQITAGASAVTNVNTGGRFSYYGGGSGGAGSVSSPGAGGGSYYGGGGGGGSASSAASGGSGGLSKLGGNGGAGGGSSSNGVIGSQPAGGGGGGMNGYVSGAGGDGMCVVKVYA